MSEKSFKNREGAPAEPPETIFPEPETDQAGASRMERELPTIPQTEARAPETLPIVESKPRAGIPEAPRPIREQMTSNDRETSASIVRGGYTASQRDSDELAGVEEALIRTMDGKETKTIPND